MNLGKSYFAICVACHGSQAEGNTALQAPRLNQLPAWYLTAQLQSYRNGTRGNHVEDRLGQQMRQVAVEALPDEEAVNAVVAFIAAQGAATSLSQPHRTR
ncbi:c-type cytochrome [Roseateles sp.]|uniref:c-type cytochrome n=1 Tax=Roseateles sp. TaxID=1971397 RepID=UPI0039ECD2DC